MAKATTKSKSTATPVVSERPTERSFSAASVKGEVTRRRLNKTGRTPVRSKSWVLLGMDSNQLDAVLAGESVEVEFKKGNVTVSLRG